MKYLLFVPAALLALLALVLAARLVSLRRALREICAQLDSRISEDTNALISVSTRDRSARALASRLNVQLRLLRDERRRFQQGDLELKEAVTNISHDLRTPLTAISGYLDLVEPEEKSAALERALTQIRGRTDALTALTEELFRYSVAASAKPLHSERLDVVQVLEESLLSFYAALSARAITPQISLPKMPVYRLADAAALSRIFSNIISNALKYSDGDLRVDMDESGCIRFSNPAKNLDSVSVGRLFDRYYTVEAGRSSSGLGLSIARLLTERIGGSLDAQYADGTLCITLRLPEQPQAL
ncbi:MAG: HAMP domain-containing histidine kinase [Oscillospiraceae bacterium]|nr:HAMP domain-containing histidine kinase [Oscillospiraceae bacterium]